MAGPRVPSSFQDEAFSHLDISDTVNSETGNDEKCTLVGTKQMHGVDNIPFL